MNRAPRRNAKPPSAREVRNQLAFMAGGARMEPAPVKPVRKKSAPKQCEF